MWQVAFTWVHVLLNGGGRFRTKYGWPVAPREIALNDVHGYNSNINLFYNICLTINIKINTGSTELSKKNREREKNTFEEIESCRRHSDQHIYLCHWVSIHNIHTFSTW